MKLFLFLDDWFLDERLDVVRRFAVSRPVEVVQARQLARSSVLYDPRRKCYRAWAKVLGTRRARLYESKDGLNWRKTAAVLRLHQPQNFPFEQTWFFDPFDRDARRRYKMLCWPYEQGIEGGPGVLAYSADGATWRLEPRHRWYTHPRGSDTINNLFYNPFTGRWCAVCRKRNADRRVALVESADLEHWTSPRVIIHPDSLDAPLQQFYGMAAGLYEGEYFIGWLQNYRVNSTEAAGRIKMQGAVDGQLAYSYDGETWLRTDRTTQLPRGEPGSATGGGIYPSAMTPAPDGGLYVYCLATAHDHGFPDPRREYLVVCPFRRDGFAWLEPVGGWGTVLTRTLVPTGGSCRLNFLAPAGAVLVQAATPNREPIPGYTFDDSLPLRGDRTAAPVRWKKHRDLSGLAGRPIRLELRLRDARLYAIRLDAKLWYTHTAQPIDRP